MSETPSWDWDLNAEELNFTLSEVNTWPVLKETKKGQSRLYKLRGDNIELKGFVEAILYMVALKGYE